MKSFYDAIIYRLVANLYQITYLIKSDAGARCNRAERGFMDNPTA